MNSYEQYLHCTSQQQPQQQPNQHNLIFPSSSLYPLASTTTPAVSTPTIDNSYLIESLLRNVEQTLTCNSTLLQALQFRENYSDMTCMNYTGMNAQSNYCYTTSSRPSITLSDSSITPLNATTFQTSESLDAVSEPLTNSNKQCTVVELSEPSSRMNGSSSFILNEEELIRAQRRAQRQLKIAKYRNKRRNWNKQVAYDCRKVIADTRIRVKGRFVSKKETTTIKEMVGESECIAFNSKRNLSLDFVNKHLHENKRVDSTVSKGSIIQQIEQIVKQQHKKTIEDTPAM